ncbi:restriction endonuclease subunit S [Campylobacter jejuni]|uniref:Restriction endonuclease subunit S n=1 Tax=Campylobacter jejuni TaxID=197 RepID=A0A3X8PNV0_CAMJU|nr:restriction endonuclease subunit S [Campylobacter jejuni]EIX2549067.1 restriction endonuclease subunit S [Campylobacter coli]EAB5237541.1 restriction endonuclease subunit S [Campylobacter jejuni]EAB5263891.1 restriction endonuclease subunit S [Campylobacter jejuni]EAB5317235.1 restriction endonuclease subunit S [Campylobacter jejuni]EAB5416946.1 restriction endonuclease subunit S [Campylobacter jejuni]
MKNFKDSGIEWLGEIPEHWEVVTLKYLVEKIIGGGTPDTSNLDYWTNNKKDGYLWVSIEDITKSSFITDTKRYITQDGLESSSAKLIPPFSILYSIYASLGKIAYSDQILTTNQAILGIQSNHKLVFYKFLFYCLCNTTNYVTILSSMTTQNNISLSVVANLKIPVPPLKEQEQIANFLDEKCEQIANFIEKKEKLINLLKEQKQTLINETITKGLDKNINFKDSGIEHLGEIPQHWNILKLKYIAYLRNQKSNNIDFRIGLENIESKTGKFIPSSEVVFEEDGIGFEKGDILFGKLRPYLAKVFLADRSGICVSEFLVLKIKSESNKFIKFLMLSSLFIDIVDSSTYGTKMPRANWEFIGNLKIPLPPLKEQEQIANFLDSEISKIDKIIEKTEKQIELIKEYKTTLINQAVCGRINL